MCAVAAAATVAVYYFTDKYTAPLDWICTTRQSLYAYECKTECLFEVDKNQKPAHVKKALGYGTISNSAWICENMIQDFITIGF